MRNKPYKNQMKLGHYYGKTKILIITGAYDFYGEENTVVWIAEFQ